MINKDIIVNVDYAETRAGILEDEKLVEFFIERPSNKQIAGNIYKGKIVNVLPGMQAAFVDIGLDRNAFLYVDDAIASLDLREDIDIEEDEVNSIKDVVKVGQELLVQITKEPIGTKGARVVTSVTLPGRYVVLMPTVNYVGISRRISDETERNRLKELAHSVRPKGMGIIVRTVAEGQTERELASDVKFLMRVWKNIQKNGKNTSAPELLYEDHDLVYRLVRDQLTEDISRFVIDSKSRYDDVISLLSVIGSNLKKKVRLYQKESPIFDYFAIEPQIERGVRQKIWLDCGGYLIFDQTEALTVIDVNTGKYIGSTNLSDTVLKTNIEATREIASQLRLRDIGGIIIIDFIDMNSSKYEKKVIGVFEDEIKKDKTKTHILGFTRLGLLEVTRKKVKEGLGDLLQKNCSYCEGEGKVLSEETMASKIEREIKRIARRNNVEAILIKVHPSVASILIGGGGINLKRIENQTGIAIYIKGSDAVHCEEFQVVHKGTKETVENMALPVKEGEVIEVKIEEAHVSNTENGIARVEGYVIDIENAGNLVGERKKVAIEKTFRTYAKAKVV